MPWNFYIGKYLDFAIRKIIKNNTIIIDGVPVEMGPFIAERAVEIPFAIDSLRKFSYQDVIEVGNVLKHYGPYQHLVVDKYEKMEGVVNEDILTFSPMKKYECIICISTIEHIGFDELPREEGKIEKVLYRLYNDFLKDSGRMVLTFPLGYNPTIDRIIKEHEFQNQRLTIFKHSKMFNQWEVVGEIPKIANWVPEKHFLEYFCLWEIAKGVNFVAKQNDCSQDLGGGK